MICYDGSEDAAAAIAFTADLVPGAHAIVVTVWKPIIEELLAGPPEAPPISDPVDANEQQRRAAAERAREGARRASAAGLEAEALAVRAMGAEVAFERSARFVVCGTSRSGVKSALPGNLAGALLQHASRPVLVVPSPKAAAERRRMFEKEHRPSRLKATAQHLAR
jgi:nucleotide-binding universal stress UspA family protein